MLYPHPCKWKEHYLALETAHVAECPDISEEIVRILQGKLNVSWQSLGPHDAKLPFEHHTL